MSDVDRLASIGMQLAGRVRDDDPESYGRWLDAMFAADPDDYRRLCFVLAALVPDDRTESQLLAWLTGEPIESVERRRQQWRESSRRRRLRAVGAGGAA